MKRNLGAVKRAAGIAALVVSGITVLFGCSAAPPRDDGVASDAASAVATPVAAAPATAEAIRDRDSVIITPAPSGAMILTPKPYATPKPTFPDEAGGSAANDKKSGEFPPGPKGEKGDASSERTVDAIVATLRKAATAFVAPSSMHVGEQKTVELILSPTKSEAALKETLQSRGTVATDQARFAHTMEAVLKGKGFDIVSITPESQAVSESEDTKWTWSVTALEPGKKTLYLTLNAVLLVDGKNAERVISQPEKEILVDVTWDKQVSMFFSGNWQWLWTTLFVPVGAWIWGRLRGKEKTADKQEKEA